MGLLGFPGSSAGKKSICNAGDLRKIPWRRDRYQLQYSWASLVAQMVKNSPAIGRPQFNPWVGKILWRNVWQPTPIFLPGESPWTEEPGRLQAVGSQTVRHDWTTKHIAHMGLLSIVQRENEWFFPPKKTHIYLFSTQMKWNIILSDINLGLPCGLAGKESACNAGDLDLIPGLGRSPGEGKCYLLQYSGLENPEDCIVHGVTKIQTRLSEFHFQSLI